MEYQYGVCENGMYVDGHEHADVVKYQMDVFLPFCASIDGQMMKWDNENIPILPNGIPTFPQKK